MGEFFKGWRRKIGCVTLVLACAILGMWLRSFTTTGDHVTVWNHSLYSHNGSVSWYVNYHDDSPRGIQDVIEFHAGSNKLFDPRRRILEKARWAFCGLVYSDQVVAGNGIRQYWITYWCFISPLTLLSAYLLLSHPRVAKPDSADENRSHQASGQRPEANLKSMI